MNVSEYHPREGGRGSKKGVYLKTIDYERMFHSLSQPAIIANHYNINSEVDREKLNDLIFTRYDGDTLSNIPQCDGGHLKGEYNTGLFCTECQTYVVPVTEKPLESMLWMEVPEGVPGFVNLTVWRILSKELTYSGFNVLEWLTNPFYRPSVKSPPIMRKMSSLNLPTGLSNFHDHYDEIIESLFRNRIFRGTVSHRNKLQKYLKKVRDITFCKRLPFPSKLGFITEKNNDKVYADHKMGPALDAIWTIVGMYSGAEEPSTKMKESRCVKAIVQLVQYYKDFETNIAFKKEGIFRKLIYGTRPHWTYRAVISSNHKPHDYETIELPWSLSVLLFKSHLSNKLLKRQFTPNDIFVMLYENTLGDTEAGAHPVLESLFNELIEEAGGKGIPTTFARNPTLKRGSIQRFFINKIKTDPSINTVSFSVLDLKAPNADYDGDALNGQLLLDHKTEERVSRMAPHLGVMDLNRPFRVSRNVALPTPVLSTINHWISEGDDIAPFEEVETVVLKSHL